MDSRLVRLRGMPWGEKLPDEWRDGACRELGGCSRLFNAAVVEHGDPIGQAQGLFVIMSHE
jgi:hypothetical protein